MYSGFVPNAKRTFFVFVLGTLRNGEAVGAAVGTLIAERRVGTAGGVVVVGTLRGGAGVGVSVRVGLFMAARRGERRRERLSVVAKGSGTSGAGVGDVVGVEFSTLCAGTGMAAVVGVG